MVIVTMMVFAGQVFAVEVDEKGWEYSGSKTADAEITGYPIVIKQLFVETDGTNNCKVALHDGTSNSASTAVPPLTCIATAGGCTTRLNVKVDKLYADMTVSAGSCTYEIHFVRD